MNGHSKENAVITDSHCTNESHVFSETSYGLTFMAFFIGNGQNYRSLNARCGWGAIGGNLSDK